MSGAAEGAVLRTLADKQAIAEVLYLYARGWDRKDEEALHACFHPDATLGFGAYEGGAGDFIAMGLEMCGPVTAMSHLIVNPMILVSGDGAVSECSFLAHHRRPDAGGGQEDMFLKGRYLDRFERRDGTWRIARREAYSDFERVLPTAERDLAAAPPEHRGRFKPDDALYALLGPMIGGGAAQSCA